VFHANDSRCQGTKTGKDATETNKQVGILVSLTCSGKISLSHTLHILSMPWVIFKKCGTRVQAVWEPSTPPPPGQPALWPLMPGIMGTPSLLQAHAFFKTWPFKEMISLNKHSKPPLFVPKGGSSRAGVRDRHWVGG
jgi:hypothetical protein